MGMESAWDAALAKAKIIYNEINILDTPSNMRCAILDYRVFMYWDETDKKVMVRDSEFCEAEYIQTPQGGVLKVFKHTTTSRIGAGPGHYKYMVI